MSDLDILYDRNEGFARTFDQGDLPILPRRPTIVLTCVDSRVDPAHFLGLELGDTLVPPELVVSAHLYDVKSGRVSQVVPPATLNKE